MKKRPWLAPFFKKEEINMKALEWHVLTRYWFNGTLQLQLYFMPLVS